MEALRKRKVAAHCGAAGEGRVLRSRSGKAITEQALSDAVQQMAAIQARAPGRGLGAAADASMQIPSALQAAGNRRPAKRAASGSAALQPHNSAPAAIPSTADGTAELAGTALASAGAVVSLAAPSSWTEASMAAALEHLSKADPLLAPLIREHGPANRLLPSVADSAFHALANVVISQQLSFHVARIISDRVATAAGAAPRLEPGAVLALTPEQLRACGLSGAKVRYIADLAQRFSCGDFTTERIVAMDDADLYAELTAVKGIGTWSVDMFAMFQCGRPDILPVGDLAVRKGFQTLYGLKGMPSAEQMEAIAEKWRPYRSLGSYYMWRVQTPRALKKSKSMPVGVTV